MYESNKSEDTTMLQSGPVAERGVSYLSHELVDLLQTQLRACGQVGHDILALHERCIAIVDVLH